MLQHRSVSSILFAYISTTSQLLNNPVSETFLGQFIGLYWVNSLGELMLGAVFCGCWLLQSIFLMSDLFFWGEWAGWTMKCRGVKLDERRRNQDGSGVEGQQVWVWWWSWARRDPDATSRSSSCFSEDITYLPWFSPSSPTEWNC